MSGYDSLAPFYDAVMGDRSAAAAYVGSLIERHHPEAHSVLELACGTGSILERLDARYELTGVDLSARMLEQAATNAPRARLVQGDMTSVRLGESFDVVLCVFDSINHLLAFEQWEAVFDRANEHLNSGGIFVFDVNTPRKLAELAAGPASVYWFDENALLLDVVAGGGDVYLWRLRVFEHAGGSDYRLHTADIPETAFELSRIKPALADRFARVSVYDAERSRPSASSQRLHFVCRRRPDLVADSH
jgi:SAM-dependent methyltransferase